MAGQSLLENGGTLVGHCVNFLPIRSRFDATQSLADSFKQARKKLLDAQDHQNYTYGTLLRKLKIQRDPRACLWLRCSSTWRRWAPA